MFTSLRSFTVVLVALFLVHPSAWANTLKGVVKNSSGQPLSNAQIRIEGKEGSGPARVTRTDEKGRYVYTALTGTGTYAVTLVVNGIVKASISNVAMVNGDVTTLNFELQGRSSAQPLAAGRHYIFVPDQTGSHLGHWVEVADRSESSLGMRDRMDRSGQELMRNIQSNSDAVINR
jgi:hypothetical protein